MSKIEKNENDVYHVEEKETFSEKHPVAWMSAWYLVGITAGILLNIVLCRAFKIKTPLISYEALWKCRKGCE